jgi:hypothetical protein
MKKLIILPLIICTLLLVSNTQVFAARLVLDAPTAASSNGEPFAIIVYIDNEYDILSAVRGDMTFESDLFEVQSVSTRSSVISLWVTQPTLPEKYDEAGRTHIPFEGIIPGGYSGVRSPYYAGTKNGVMFVVTLLPKKVGTARVSLDNVELHLFDKDGTILKTEPVSTTIAVPNQSMVYSYVLRDMKETYSSTLAISVERDPLIANNAWYLSVLEDQSIRPIEHIYLAETSKYNAHDVTDAEWKEIKNIHVLSSQRRNKYLHVKVLYENRTYMIQTIPPVENSGAILYASRILIGIVSVLICILFYVFGKRILTKKTSHAPATTKPARTHKKSTA